MLKYLILCLNSFLLVRFGCTLLLLRLLFSSGTALSLTHFLLVLRVGLLIVAGGRARDTIRLRCRRILSML